MPSLLDQLQEKMQEVLTRVLWLKKERERLLAEVSLMQEENRRARRLSREHRDLVAERNVLHERLEKLLDKLDGVKI
jgi:FtsZ-binding cell division protein ZapB